MLDAAGGYGLLPVGGGMGGRWVERGLASSGERLELGPRAPGHSRVHLETRGGVLRGELSVLPPARTPVGPLSEPADGG